MMKTLTEQWKDGKLPVGSYYINLIGAVERVDFFEGLEWERTKDFGIEEVLAPVPSYDEDKKLKEQLADASKTIERLEEQLKIAKKALEKIERIKVGKENNFSILIAHSYSMEALKEMEGVK